MQGYWVQTGRTGAGEGGVGGGGPEYLTCSANMLTLLPDFSERQQAKQDVSARCTWNGDRQLATEDHLTCLMQQLEEGTSKKPPQTHAQAQYHIGHTQQNNKLAESYFSLSTSIQAQGNTLFQPYMTHSDTYH